MIAFALEALGKQRARRVTEAHLLGGAVGSSPSDWWDECSAALHEQGQIFNYYSESDMVLKYMYRFGTLFQSDPIGRSPIEHCKRVTNKDVSHWVRKHTEYKFKAEKFLKSGPSRGDAGGGLP